MSRGQEVGWSGGSERCSTVVRGRGGVNKGQLFR